MLIWLIAIKYFVQALLMMLIKFKETFQCWWLNTKKPKYFPNGRIIFIYCFSNFWTVKPVPVNWLESNDAHWADQYFLISPYISRIFSSLPWTRISFCVYFHFGLINPRSTNLPVRRRLEWLFFQLLKNLTRNFPSAYSLTITKRI